MRLLILSFLIFSVQGFAQSKFEECERALAANPRTVMIGNQAVDLKREQILVSGVMTHNQSPERPNQTFWLVSDTFLSREVIPDRFNSTRQLSNRDQVFILDSQQNIVFSGYYGEDKYQPALYKDDKLTEVILPAREFRQFFYKQHTAVAIVNLKNIERVMLENAKKVWFPLYRDHQNKPSRFVRVGTKQLERFHFERAFKGVIRAKRSVAYLTPNERKAFPKDQVYKMELKFTNVGGQLVVTQPGDRLYLIDSNGDPMEEITLGTLAAPLVGTLEDLNPFYEKLKESRPAILFQNPVIR